MYKHPQKKRLQKFYGLRHALRLQDLPEETEESTGPLCVSTRHRRRRRSGCARFKAAETRVFVRGHERRVCLRSFARA
ncbi:hypothetical protein L596_009653 [Steinernema carpocapsae]|uniref:Uncharacterized protein n=1 Tax=Steinernema carpocapsae TaxID=34508 RepID=A0A4U5PG59_STECR|nr:hypothetical protein L596_009653 [Steinernema carpocapsae]